MAGTPNPRTDINPALHYYQSFLLAPDLTQADRDYFFETDWSAQKLPARVGTIAARFDNQMRLVTQAARAAEACDWGIDLSAGPATLLPHLSRGKMVALAARLRAGWNLQNGNASEAADELLAALVLARNLPEGTLISSLVQVSMESTFAAAVAENFRFFDAVTLKQLLDGINSAPPRFTIAACVPNEKAFFTDWLVAKIAGLQTEFPGDEAKVLAAAKDLVSMMDTPEEGGSAVARPSLWDQAIKAAGGTSNGLVKLLQEEDALFQQATTIMSLPCGEYEPAMQKFSAEFLNSPNPFVHVTFPALDRCRPKEFAAEVQIAMVQAAIQQKLNGAAGFQTILDPCTGKPFVMERFQFEGVDRGFLLRSSYAGRGFSESLIFVEREGTGFQVIGKNAGQAVAKAKAGR